MAREVADIKAENRELRRLLQSQKPIANNNNNVEESRHPVFRKHVSLPLKTIDDFKHFEEELLKDEVRNNVVKFYINKDFQQCIFNSNILFFRSRCFAVFFKRTLRIQ